MGDGKAIKLSCVLLCFGLVWFAFSACSDDLRFRSPYPPSPVIRSISWDFEKLIKKAPGSDLWPMTWASDDNLYTSWGDGGGFGGTNSLGRVSLGFARIEGIPPGFSAHNVWGGQGAERKPAFSGKCPGMLSVDGTLYAWIRMSTAGFLQYRLAWSRNLGRDWQLSKWSFPGDGDRFVAKTFVNFGRDYQGAPDDFVYIYGGEVGRTDRIYLLRVPKASLDVRRAYMFYAGSGTDDKPVWSSKASDRVPVFIDRDNSSNAATVVYNVGLKRFIMTLPHGAVGKLGVFDAPRPWGPWTTVAYYDNWGEFGDDGALLYTFPAKWISDDGKTMWCVFSAGGSLDSFNLVRASLIVE